MKRIDDRLLTLLALSVSLVACGGTELDEQAEVAELEHEGQAVTATREYLIQPQITLAAGCLADWTIELKSHGGTYRTHQVLLNRTLPATISSNNTQADGLDAYKITIATNQACRLVVGTTQIVARDSITSANQTRIKFVPNRNAPVSSVSARPTSCALNWTIPVLNPDAAGTASDTWSTVGGDVRLRLTNFQATALDDNPVVAGCGYAAGTTATAWLGAIAPAASGTRFQAVIEVVGLNIAR